MNINIAITPSARGINKLTVRMLESLLNSTGRKSNFIDPVLRSCEQLKRISEADHYFGTLPRRLLESCRQLPSEDTGYPLLGKLSNLICLIARTGQFT